jgi:Flp pilus assembly protein TadG
LTARTQTRRFGHWMRFRIPWLVRDDASQIVEFALSLPLLVVFSVGIFDFTTAYTVKQKLANAARDCARSVAGAPAADVGNTSAAEPASVFDGRDVVANYLDNANLNSCGIRSLSPSSSGLTYTYLATGTGCPGSGLTLTINRACVYGSGGLVNIVATCVTLQYAYQWQFNRVISLLVPGATYAAVTTLKASGMAMNEN